MATETSIEWCDHTKSPWHGCSDAVLPDGSEHPGCLHCYAKRMAKRNPGTLGKWGVSGTRIVDCTFHSQCRAWNKRAAKAGKRESVFPSICDPFEDFAGNVLTHDGDDLRRCSKCGWTGTCPIIIPSLAKRSNLYGCPQCDSDETTVEVFLADLRHEMFATIDACPNLDFLLLTKRPQNIRKMWRMRGNDFRPNVWLGTSVSDQATADALIPELLKSRELSPVLFLSVEPLLGPVSIDEILVPLGDNRCVICPLSGEWAPEEPPPVTGTIDWVIVGGESGPHSRPCNVDWIRQIQYQCQASSVPYFIKQLGAFPTDRGAEGIESSLIEAYADFFRINSIKDKKGVDWNEWPQDLRVREFPETI